MNILSATIEKIVSSHHLSHLRVSHKDDTFDLLLAESGLSSELVGHTVQLAFKETEVIISKNMVSATANAAHAVVHSIDCGKILTQVTLSYRDTLLTSLVSTLIFNTLSINIGDKIIWMVQPSEISLIRDANGY